jgi:hypothetical protein
MAILTGFGYPDFLVNNNLLDIEPMEISIEGSSDLKKAKKYVNGKLVTAGTATGEETYTMKVGIEAITWQALQFGFGQLASSESSLALPERRTLTVPSSSPYEVVDADIANTSVWATIRNDGTWGKAGPLERVTGSPTGKQFKVDVSGTKLVFPSTLAGAKILYRLFKTQSAIDAIGVSQTPQLLNEFSFSGVTFGDSETGKFKIYIPKATKASIPSFNPSDVTKLEIDYELVTTTDNPLPFILTPYAG